MRSTTLGQLSALALVVMLPACGGSSSPTSATPASPPVATANVSIMSISVSAQARSGSGFSYRVIVHLKEAGGVAATITSLDIVMKSGTTTTVSSHYESPMVGGSNVCPAGGTCDSREFTIEDADATHAYATSVQATVAYADASARTATASGSGDVPPLATTPTPPTPQPTPGAPTYRLTGVISDESRQPIPNATLEVLNGNNAGKSATTDATGTYVFDALVAETFRLRASAADFTAGEQNVTVPTVPRADFTLRTSTCTMTVSSKTQNASAASSSFSAALTRVSGSCSWQVRSNASWMTVFYPTTGSDSATVFYYVSSNTTAAGRTGTVTVSWNGGSADITVNQAGGCAYSVPSSQVDVPYTAGSFSYTMHRSYGSCTWRASSFSSWLSVSPSTGGDGDSFTYTTKANASNYQQYGTIYLEAMSGSTSVGTYYLTVVQSASPTPACSYFLSPTSVTAPHAGGPYSASITRTQGDCGWTASSSASWVTVSTASGTGSGALSYSVAANSGGTSRSATVTLSWSTGSTSIAVTQQP
jgi:hypothetical protein